MLRCLAKAPAGRPQSYAELADLLRPYRSADEVPAPLGAALHRLDRRRGRLRDHDVTAQCVGVDGRDARIRDHAASTGVVAVAHWGHLLLRPRRLLGRLAREAAHGLACELGARAAAGGRALACAPPCSDLTAGVSERLNSFGEGLVFPAAGPAHGSQACRPTSQTLPGQRCKPVRRRRWCPWNAGGNSRQSFLRRG